MKSKSISILFIGNSFTYYHNLPRLISRFAETSKIATIEVDAVVQGGATLKMLWDDGKAIKKIRSKDWDYVVLQERGRLGGITKKGVVHVGKPEIFFKYGALFHKEIKKQKAKTILYAPPAWLGIGLRDDQKKMDEAYKKLSQKLKTLLVLTGPATIAALKKHPAINFYEDDHYHPNFLGTYLIASVFYKKLFKKNPVPLPLVSSSSKFPQALKIVTISKKDAHLIWSVIH